MSEIPEDIVKRAREFQAMADADPHAYNEFDVAVLSMISERERCAKIAERMLKFADTTSSADKEIAAAIRGTSPS